ncbi:MAG: pre-16S rRNA-processing nuclease YqgF [Candidatus Zipacnadales bacterium]
MTGSGPPARVIAIDPGREKCGLAIVNIEGTLLEKRIVPTPSLPVTLASLITPDTPPTHVAIGDSTACAQVRGAISELLPQLHVHLVPEHHSTERALQRWRETEPPRGWRRLLPRSLRFPSCPLDDFAAWILAEDYLALCINLRSSPGGK